MAAKVAGKLLLVTIGTLGDLHPFIAIGLALQKQGFRPVMAVPQDHVAKCVGAGLEAVAVLPGLDAVERSMALSREEAVRRLMKSQRLMMERVLIPALSECVAALDRLAEDADAVIGSVFAFAAAMVAEKRGLPLISVVLQPMAMLSAIDPPTTPDTRIMVSAPGLVGVVWNRLIYAVLRCTIDALYGGRIDAVRAAYGLPRAGARRLFEPASRSVLQLGCYSAQLAPLQRDAPPRTRIVGFPRFDSHSGIGESLPDGLAAFVAAGTPPLVFTLGTFAVGSSGSFFDRAREVATRLNRRAVLLHGGPGAPQERGDLFVCSYAPHSKLFPAAAIIIHHGGVGTTGQAMHAGKPQLVVPHMGDQNDHAARIVRMGLGLRLHASRFSPERAEASLTTLLADPGFAARAAATVRRMAGEDGATAASHAIIGALRRVADNGALKLAHDQPTERKARSHGGSHARLNAPTPL